MRSQVCRALNRNESPEPELDMLAQQLDSAYQRTAENFTSNAAVRIEQVQGRDTLTLTGLDKLDEPPSLIKLRDEVLARLPRVDLPEVLLEIHARTGFALEFTHISEGEARASDLPVSLCAVLLAEACNIGLEPVVRSDIVALTRGRLSWVQQNYIRAETLTRANANLVDTQSTIALAQAWGGGESLQRMDCASWCQSAPLTPVRIASITVPIVVSPITTSALINSWGFMASSFQAPYAIRCTSSTAYWNIRRG
jgi:Tn3 transposase DDE domain